MTSRRPTRNCAPSQSTPCTTSALPALKTQSSAAVNPGSLRQRSSRRRMTRASADSGAVAALRSPDKRSASGDCAGHPLCASVPDALRLSGLRSAATAPESAEARVVLRQLGRSRRDLGSTAADDCVFGAGEAEVGQRVYRGGAQVRAERRVVMRGAFGTRRSRRHSRRVSGGSPAVPPRTPATPQAGSRGPRPRRRSRATRE